MKFNYRFILAAWIVAMLIGAWVGDLVAASLVFMMIAVAYSLMHAAYENNELGIESQAAEIDMDNLSPELQRCYLLHQKFMNGTRLTQEENEFYTQQRGKYSAKAWAGAMLTGRIDE